MISPIRKDILQTLATLWELAPDVRFGQLIAHLGFLANDMGERSLVDIEDEALLQVIERHREELVQRQSHVA
ncbi:MAG: hypothetical protein K2R98_16630 [Gemmataceae bacterium]|nr:hypothetical protein [Gemmataceae bacterium]